MKNIFIVVALLVTFACALLERKYDGRTNVLKQGEGISSFYVFGSAFAMTVFGAVSILVLLGK